MYTKYNYTYKSTIEMYTKYNYTYKSKIEMLYYCSALSNFAFFFNT